MKLLFGIGLGAAILSTSYIVHGQDAPASDDRPITKSGYGKGGQLGGPTATPFQLYENDLSKNPVYRWPRADEAFADWFEWKRDLNTSAGVQLGTDYTTLFQTISGSATDRLDAGSGIFRLLSTWQLGSADSKLIASAEHRHQISGDTVPADLGFAAGYLGIPGTLFSDVGAIVGNVYWSQAISDGAGGVIVGRFDPNDFMDVLGYASPWTGFQNAAVMVNTSMALPDWSYGVGIGHFLTDHVYAIATLNDANGTITNLEFFESGSEFFKQVTVGWTPSQADRYERNFHAMLWHVDERVDAGVAESWGMTLGAIWKVHPNWVVFGRYGNSDGTTPLYNQMATVGFARRVNEHQDGFAAGLNWGQPADPTLNEQISIEVLYNLQFAENFEITPSVQWLLDPAQNDQDDALLLFGLRARLTL